ncbi:MbtH family protein [Serratia symbiotica]|uniref:MbtH domain-containing protein n=2 Tax=Serratia symbiotica TaxID=138074 RepID=E9CKD1_9GAMM|nr:MbtH family protein [Serratia symbiotica]EFW13043.1 MbtH domain-containing protein [Serratia symbiotica str. Tucson]MBF1995289.1 MbtH family protein [Serratia symbiotica]MBQ0956105.1 MbtH family protein [Serratia symbiotica]QLH63039.1 MbtH family protein [Serratia symbiotica]QTP15253.1 MbtH family protein [Serratia symbiotica]
MSQQHQNPFDDESQPFFVLMNAQQQYSLWPEFAAIPAGWQSVFGPESRANCIAWVEQVW